MEKWVVSAKRADFQEISRKFGVDPVIARLIRNREQITDEEIEKYLHGRLSDLPLSERYDSGSVRRYVDEGYGQGRGPVDGKNQGRQ